MKKQNGSKICPKPPLRDRPLRSRLTMVMAEVSHMATSTATPASRGGLLRPTTRSDRASTRCGLQAGRGVRGVGREGLCFAELAQLATAAAAASAHTRTHPFEVPACLFLSTYIKVLGRKRGWGQIRGGWGGALSLASPQPDMPFTEDDFCYVDKGLVPRTSLVASTL